MDLTAQNQGFLLSVSGQSEAEVLTSVFLFPPDPLKSPRGPSTCRCPSAAHHSISLIREKSALLFIVIETEEGEQHIQTQRLPVSTLNHPHSISWLQTETQLLFSHAHCDDFTPELQHFISHFSLCLFLLPVTFPHTQSWLLLIQCPAGMVKLHLRQKGCVKSSQETMTRGGERKGKNWFGWVSSSSRNYHRAEERACGQRVEPAEQNCYQVVQEINL